jgi:hypothetical protein
MSVLVPPCRRRSGYPLPGGEHNSGCQRCHQLDPIKWPGGKSRRIGERSHPTMRLHDEDITSVTSALQAVRKMSQVA